MATSVYLVARSVFMQTRIWCRYALLLPSPVFIISARKFQTISMIEFLGSKFVCSYYIQNDLFDGWFNLGVANP